MPLLEIRDLTLAFPSQFGTVTAVRDFDLTLDAGRIHGLVGESGAGKSTIGAAILGLLPGTGHVAAGSIRLGGRELTDLDARQWHGLRGSRISMIFQDPQTSLNPLFTVQEQLVETIRRHRDVARAEAEAQAVDLLETVGIRDAAIRITNYPHQFSGGMRQRVVIALALASEPELIIADEPTTALDVSVQKQVLGLIRGLARNRAIGVLLITHDMGVIAETTDSVSVLLDGKCVETGPTADILGRPQDRYTKGLIASVPRIDRKLQRFPEVPAREPRIEAPVKAPVDGADIAVATEWLLGDRSDTIGDASDRVVLAIEDLSVDFGGRPTIFGRQKPVAAVAGASLAISAGETLGLVGESGSGKSTIAKTIVGIHRARSGAVVFRGQALSTDRRRPRDDPSRREIQMIFQDPYSSLNNRWRVVDIIGEPLRVYGLASGRESIRRIAASMLLLVGLPQSALFRYPHQFSGGQRQRIAIARALVARPRLLICDEPTSALDVSVQAQILNLFKDIQRRFGLSMLFISHDLPVVRQLSDDIAVMHNGRIVEAGPSEAFFESPKDDYSRGLLSETPSLALLGEPDRLAKELQDAPERPISSP